MAEFEAQATAIRATGHELLALAVDDPARSEPVRQRLRLSFPILCDQRRTVVKAWDLFNEQERGGIAVPAVLVLDRDGTVRHAWTETVATRVTADGVLAAIRGVAGAGERRIRLGLGDMVMAIGNVIRRGGTTPTE